MKYSLNEISNLLEKHFYKDLSNAMYEVKKVQAYTLLTHSRLDIAFKILYLEMLGYDVAFSEEIYKEHIRAFSLGKFTEPGNDNKDSIDKFIEEFKRTYESIEVNGFNSKETLIPLSTNGSIANGAHRVASAIFLDKEVNCVELETTNHMYDYKFFYNRNISSAMLDVVATKFVEYSNNTYIAFIWPTANSSWETIEKIIPSIVYQKEVTFNYNGAHNLLSQIYYGEEWLGTVENDFSGSKGKLVECFKTFNPVKVVAFQAENLDEVLKIKEKVREVFNVGKHSVHISDTKEEAIRTARMVFNDNSIHFLNYAKPNRYLSNHTKIEKFKKFLKKNSLSSVEVLIDESMTLSVYGLREVKDIVYFCSDSKKVTMKRKGINEDDEVLLHYAQSKNEMIHNSLNYFYFNDVKFISFTQLYKMKMNRAGVKDRNDCKMMEALIENNMFKSVIHQYKQKFFYGQILLRQRIIKLLQRLGVFDVARKAYRKIKGFNE